MPSGGRRVASETSVFVIVSTATGRLPCFTSIYFPVAIGTVLLVVTYIVMLPDAKTLCEVAS